MPRYIDADKMLRFLTEHNDEKDLMVSRYNADWIISFIETQPTADVVPRSEFEELIRENESLAKTVNKASELIRKLRSKVEKSKTKVAPTVSKMEQVRSEVVREIFAELDNFFNLLCTDNDDRLIYLEIKKKLLERSDTK